MEPLTVYTTQDGLICIEQAGMGENERVVINPSQVGILFEWLREAAEEIANQSN